MLGSKTNLHNTTIKAVIGLTTFLDAGMRSQLETCRLARAGYALLQSGCSATVGTFPGSKLAYYIIKMQQNDGGWADVEETIWSIGYISNLGTAYHQKVLFGKKWLASIRLSSGAWGRTSRDQPRIPITALINFIIPEIGDRRSSAWLANEWKADLNRTTPLTYKGAFFLLGQRGECTTANENLTKRTIRYLVQEQNEDGGFAPWKGHPIGSDPWTTGIVLWGLASSGKLASKTTIKRAIQWLESTQLSNGLWPYHYLDDGTAMALIGLKSALGVLRK